MLLYISYTLVNRRPGDWRQYHPDNCIPPPRCLHDQLMLFPHTGGSKVSSFSNNPMYHIMTKTVTIPITNIIRMSFIYVTSLPAHFIQIIITTNRNPKCCEHHLDFFDNLIHFVYLTHPGVPHLHARNEMNPIIPITTIGSKSISFILYTSLIL